MLGLLKSKIKRVGQKGMMFYVPVDKVLDVACGYHTEPHTEVILYCHSDSTFVP